MKDDTTNITERFEESKTFRHGHRWLILAMIGVTGADVPSVTMMENAKLTEAGIYSTDAGRGRQVAGAFSNP